MEHILSDNHREKNIKIIHDLSTLTDKVLVISRFIEKIIYVELF
jgi:hypothetical protein